MKKFSLLLFTTFITLIVSAQTNCDKARNFTHENGQIQAFTQDFYMYKCACENEGLARKDLEKKVIAAMTYDKKNIQQMGGSTQGLVIPSSCKIIGSSSSDNTNAQTSNPYQQFMQQFQNIQNAENLKNRGIGIAQAFSDQVKQYSQLYQTSSPEALLQEFNKNLETIVELQRQNKVDNLNQVGNTLNAAVTDWSSGNYDGALFSTLSLLDQAEAKKEARRKAEIYKAQLIRQAQQKMSEFYWKAENLNNQTIDEYYKRAAYAFTKAEKDYLLEFVTHHECFGESMKNNFSFYSTSWTQNNCAVPIKVNSIANNLVAKDVQYIQAAERKYKLFQQTGRNEFQQGAIRFAAMAANTNPKADYYYLMGHYAGVNNSLVAYESFLAAKSKNAKYFQGDKAAEFYMVELSLQETFKEAIEENDQDVIANIIGANLHQSVSIDGYQPVVYAIKIDQADVVQAFLNTELEGKPQSAINSKVQDVIMLAAALDAPKTIERFVEMGFAVDFEVKGQSPLDVAEKNLALNSFTKITEFLGGQSKYSFENSDLIKIRDLSKAANTNDTQEIVRIYQLLTSKESKEKAIKELLHGSNRKGFFEIHKIDNALVASWAKSNQRELYTQCFKDLLNRTQLDAWKYFDQQIINLESGTNLTGWKKELFNSIAIDIAVEMENTGEKNLDMVFTDQAYSGMNKYFYEADKSEFSDFNFDGFKYSSIIVKDLTNNSLFGEINLIDFAIKRRDKKLLKTLLTDYKYVHVKNETLPINEKTLKSEGYNLDSDFLLMRTVREYGFWSEDCYGNKNQFTPEMVSGLSTPSETEYEILHMLIFEFGFDEDAIKIICDHGIFRYGSKDDFSMYSNFKKLIDELIESGHKSTFLTTWRYEQFKSSGNQQIKNDKKYWKAIVNGDYAKRY